MTPHREPATPASLASAGLPPRVRRVLERSLHLVSEELDHGLTRMLDEFERELFRLADLARNPGAESGYMQTLRSFRLNRADLVPRFMIGIERALAAIRRPAATRTDSSAPGEVSFRNLSLVETAVMDEGTVLREVGSRQEGRATLALHLLGQRFGVLAGKPAFDAIRLPLGPHVLCDALREAAVALEITHDARLLLYRIFDRQVMGGYPQLLDRVNELMVAEEILPALTFVPLRARPTPVLMRETLTPSGGRPSGAPAQPGAAPQPAGQTGAGAVTRPHTAWFGEPQAEEDNRDEAAAFATLQELLSGRRALLGKLRPGRDESPRRELGTTDLVGKLRALQQQPPASASQANLLEIKRAVLAQTRHSSGEAAALSPEDNDTFELLDLLYQQLESELRRDAPTAGLVRQLQVPLLRMALLDRAFFLRSQHPARQLLNTVAESAARWMDRDELDPQLIEPLQQAVADVVAGFDQDPEVFAQAQARLQERMQAHVRRAEMTERRHVEAARGKEKLEVARQRAGEALTREIGEHRLPRFARALLNQAWSDVLTLTLLRQGEESDAWKTQLDVTRRVVAACSDGGADDALAAQVEESLGQVGYHGEEARVIAQRLAGCFNDEEDPASRTELAMKLKARVRLGEDKAAQAKPKPPPRTPAEQAQYEQLRVMPFGVWIDFVQNQQGDISRRRLSWFSPITDNALFVNQRGQRAAEVSLDSLARMLVNGQARMVTADRGRLVDRAWQAAVNTLRSFAGRGEGAPPNGVPA
ncbi:DUF1631 domain-containing protein [Luteimonas sp. YGD11-2]|uniref:DUF1631 domain-containing protein n=1 Tax=Luteimonas sp. YGD11-2 TaxID=2508168 RepID=UPI00100BAFA4|nr:DUF1631 domain-containing protein [Luteimonas sp. YGD11-2]